MGGDLPEHRAAPFPPAVAALRRHAGRSAVLLDFDGTLAPIVDDPAAARPLPGAGTVLRQLVQRYRLVAVVSGRPAAFLAARLDVPGLVRVGSYGLEEVTDAGVVELPDASAWREVVTGVVTATRSGAPPGVLVEDKGLSVTVHYRAEPGEAEWVRAWSGREAARTGLVAHDAKRSVELRPPLAVDKGTVVASLVARAGVSAACVCGDDTGDLPAFGAVDGLDPVLRVVSGSGETPPEVLAAADLVVDGPTGVLRLLRALLS